MTVFESIFQSNSSSKAWLISFTSETDNDASSPMLRAKDGVAERTNKAMRKKREYAGDIVFTILSDEKNLRRTMPFYSA